MKKLFETIGWILFTMGSAIYLCLSILEGNLIGGIASFAFLFGCVFFLVSEQMK